ncbi:MAG: transcriptional regulator, partial [Armatimonadota bacterium]
RQVRARHCREGYVTSCRLGSPGDLEDFTHYASDNDGLWTALYVAAECFRYAVTGSEEARRWAWESTRALLDLERRTPIPGFPARACVREGEEVIKSGGEWHRTETYHAPGAPEPGPSPDGAWEWKGDTSSDELDGHYFALSIFYDLVGDEEQKQEISEVVERITDHLIDNDLLLIDVDGRHTRWGVFSPRYLNGSWEPERGLNSLAILSHLRVAHHICGHDRYVEAARGLIERHHYAINTINQKILPPGDVNHSDDELAFLCYYPLLTYETDPDLRQLYLVSLERSWRIERPERNPLWNLIYGALTGNACDVEAAAATLAEIPLDMVNWPVRNSHRADIECGPRTGRFGEVECIDPLPADERPIGRWNANPYRLDGGGDGCSEEDATHYLLPYWLGRYHGLLA